MFTQTQGVPPSPGLATPSPQIGVINLGEAVAKKAVMVVSLELDKFRYRPEDGREVYLGQSSAIQVDTVFPRQTLQLSYKHQVALPIDPTIDFGMYVNISIRYHGPFSVRWKGLSYGIYETHQPLYIESDGNWRLAQASPSHF